MAGNEFDCGKNNISLSSGSRNSDTFRDNYPIPVEFGKLVTAGLGFYFLSGFCFLSGFYFLSSFYFLSAFLSGLSWVAIPTLLPMLAVASEVVSANPSNLLHTMPKLMLAHK